VSALALGPVAAAGRIRAEALRLGFDLVGIADVAPLEARERYEAWLASGRHGDMAYLATPRHRERRADLDRILPGVRSVVCVALCYPPSDDAARARRLGRIARYAAGEDYHRVMADKLAALETLVVELLPGARALGYADTGAILERAWAQRAGLGWIAKNTCLISPRIGSWLFLGELLVDRDLAADPPFALDHCGTCRRCIDVCPTQAIVAPHELDARRCISYLTIEHRGAIPRELRPAVGDWVFGCDLCQEVCPWNRFAPPAREARLHARALDGWTLERFLELDDAAFRALFADSPIKRARRDGFLRNVCVALGNRGEASALPALAHTLASDPAALVRSHAAWAIGEITARSTSGDAVGILSRAAESDADAAVREEAALALTRARAPR
jgi:epoxyqueuosine reductase